MPRFASAVVREILEERRGLQRVLLDDGARAYVLTDLVGPVAVGDEVVVNTTAVDLGLGTGGWHVVHWNTARRGIDRLGAGRILKLRYTSLQLDVAPPDGASPMLPVSAVDLDGQPMVDLDGQPMVDLDGQPMVDLGGRPVVICGLHSQLGVVAAVLAEQAPDARVAYVMTDGAALPLALSDLVADLCERELIAVTVTAGHAFGGDIEAVNVPSALELAVRAGADIVIVAMGPGVVGTGTALGTTALEVAPAIDAAAALGGAPIVAARRSDVDERARHRGLSHHTTTSLGLAARPSDVAHASGTPGFEVPPPHRVVTVDVPPVGALLAGFDLIVRTMGRGPEDDPLFFRTSAAAGVLAARSHRSRATVRP